MVAIDPLLLAALQASSLPRGNNLLEATHPLLAAVSAQSSARNDLLPSPNALLLSALGPPPLPLSDLRSNSKNRNNNNNDKNKHYNQNGPCEPSSWERFHLSHHHDINSGRIVFGGSILKTPIKLFGSGCRPVWSGGRYDDSSFFRQRKYPDWLTVQIRTGSTKPSGTIDLNLLKQIMGGKKYSEDEQRGQLLNGGQVAAGALSQPPNVAQTQYPQQPQFLAEPASVGTSEYPQQQWQQQSPPSPPSSQPAALPIPQPLIPQPSPLSPQNQNIEPEVPKSPSSLMSQALTPEYLQSQAQSKHRKYSAYGEQLDSERK